MATTAKISKDRRPSLGVVAICKNEEADLPGFISHLKSWVDEIVVVDDGSTDKSVIFLKQCGPKVKLVEQVMDPETGFAGQRNRGIQETTADWLLHMDIDERVPPDLAHEILDAISNQRYPAYRYRRLNFFLHRPMKGGGFADWNNVQLARNGFHHFENAVHETCIVHGGPESIGQLHQRMWHLNDASYDERMEKSLVYCRNQSRRLMEKGITVQWYHLVLLPAFEFFRKLIMKKGICDGMPGLIFAIHSACAMFRACALLWDCQNPVKRSGIEERLQKSWAGHGKPPGKNQIDA